MAPAAGGPASSCPRCGFTEPGPVECPQCGVLFARLKPARPAPAVDRAASYDAARRRFTWVDGALLVALASAAFMFWSHSSQPPAARGTAPESEAPPPSSPTPGPAPRAAADPAQGSVPGLTPAAWPEPPAENTASGAAAVVDPSSASISGALSPEERVAVGRLLDASHRGEIDSAHIDEAEDLFARHPDEPPVRQALERLLAAAAVRSRQQGRSADAIRYLERAAEVQPEARGHWSTLIDMYEASASFRDAERTARRALSALPEDASLHVALAKTLVKQNRDDEAAEVLRRFLSRRDDPAARTMLAQLERETGAARGMTRRSSSHFSLSFDGEANDALGREVLKVLEEKHTMLARILGFEPGIEVPVVLYPREAFRSVSQASKWAGGYYSHFDGRIRIGTRDLSAGFVPLDLERTLTHELTHAFVHRRTQGLVPRDINEGLAQYLSGARLGYRLEASRAQAQDGRIKVDDFYDSALSFVEYLLGRYGQSAMNELLEQIGKTGDVDQAFRRAYSRQTYGETRQEWLKQLQ
jgi:hypothetical protein